MIIIQLCKIIILGCNFVKDDNSFLFVLSKASGASSTTKLPQDKGGIWCSASLPLMMRFLGLLSTKILSLYMMVLLVVVKYLVPLMGSRCQGAVRYTVSSG
jgi:hypothetical protein